jgi:3',5'-cyclic-nucleotide phosphodiesterase
LTAANLLRVAFSCSRRGDTAQPLSCCAVLDLTRFAVGARKEVLSEQAGIALTCLKSMAVINTCHCRSVRGYHPWTDGRADNALLCVPTQLEGSAWAVVLRGPRRGVFNPREEDRLQRLTPLIVKALMSFDKGKNTEADVAEIRGELNSLRSLIDVLGSLSAELNPEKLVRTIIEGGRTLTSSDRCALFLVNPTRDRLISYLQTGLQAPIDIPIDAGIAGRTVVNRTLINIPDAYTSSFFDPSTDRESGYHTKSILSVPIYNNRGEMMECTEMINKQTGTSFSDWDVKLIQLFNVFCGIGLENARLYKDSVDLHQHL